jgi:hypothetical protein
LRKISSAIAKRPYNGICNTSDTLNPFRHS